MEREAVVSFRDVDFSYNSVPVLENVSFTIYDKSFISIVGPNAGGKTTLLDEPTSNVDMAVETELFELLNVLSKTITVIVVSHDLGFVSQYVQRVVCVNRRVAVHPTAAITGEMISDLYGAAVRMVQHDHRE